MFVGTGAVLTLARRHGFRRGKWEGKRREREREKRGCGTPESEPTTKGGRERKRDLETAEGKPKIRREKEIAQLRDHKGKPRAAKGKRGISRPLRVNPRSRE